VFAATISEENEGDVVVLKVGEGLRGAGDWARGAEENTIYA